MARLLPLSSLFLVALACAPYPEGDDQVPDTNVTNTAQKDGHWDYASNPVVDAAVTPLLAKAPGCAVGVMVGGEIDYLHAYGWAEAEKAPGLTTSYTELGGQDILNPDAAKLDGEWDVGTTAAIGSVSKMFTAAAAVRLARDPDSGITMATTLGEALGTDGTMADQTLEDLLTHASGVGVTTTVLANKKSEAFAPTFTPAGAQDATHPMQHPRLAFAYYENEPVQGTPTYSNIGYAAAGAVIDDWAAAHSDTYDTYERWVWWDVGHPYPSAFHADSMDSLALTHSWRDGDIPSYARGYRADLQDEQWVGWDRFDAWEEILDASACAAYPGVDAGCLAAYEGWEGPAGGWTLTIGDLTRLMIAFENDALVSQPTFAQMREASTTLEGVGDYGWGMEVVQEYAYAAGDNLDGANDPSTPAIVGHTGRIAGHTAILRYWPGHDKGGVSDKRAFGVAIVCNSNAVGKGELHEVARGLRGAYYDGGLLDTDGPPPGESWASLPPQEPVPAPDLGFRLLAVDLSRAWLTAPEDLALPLLPGATVPLVEVAGTSKGVGLRMGAGKVDSGRAVQDTSVAVLQLGFDPYRANPAVHGSTVGVWKLPTSEGTVVLEDVSVSGSFVEGGEHLVAMTLAGKLDLRSVARLGDSGDRTTICREYGDEGVCGRCADGAAWCLPITVAGLEASQVSGSLR